MPAVRATYRLQLHAGFPLSAARALVPYLSRLGVSHLHCSPVLRSRRGSTHGYDVVDPTLLDPELGTEEDLAALHRELAARGMGIILDIVPNHMAASDENPAWDDVLAHGPASRYARWFDIDWRANERELHGRVLLPVLGEPPARVLERDEISLALRDGIPRVRYYERSFPLDPRTLAPILAEAAAGCEREIGAGHTPCTSLADIARQLKHLPRRRTSSPRALQRRRERSAEALARLRRLAAEEPKVVHVLGEVLAGYGGTVEGRARLRRLLDLQVYRLVHWRRAAREINYRRFFDVDDLVALHMEDPEVFAETHALVLEWHRRGWIDGFRIDHPDGLLDPAGYFARLAESAFGGERRPPVYAEKILAHGERLRSWWHVAGTTGYDFLNQVESLFVSPEGFAAIEREYHRVIRQPLEFGAVARQGKRLVLESGLSAGVRRLAQRLLKLAGPDRPLPGVSVAALARAIVDTIAALPVYRTYVDERAPLPDPDDRALLAQALDAARARARAAPEALDLLAAALLGGEEGPMGGPALERFRLRFVQRFQQLSGPAAAKGVEDTAFYVYTPLLSLNEVGGGPDAPLRDAVEEFHAANADRAERFPAAMLAATTHDTKRSADVRARLDVLSEIPDTWAARLDYWRRLNLPNKTTVNGRKVPEPNTVQHLCQAIVGLWPIAPPGPGELQELQQRLDAYLLKAVREAKARTTWTDPDEAYEAAVSRDVAALLSPHESPRFLDDVERLVRDIARPGLWNSIARTVLQLSSPGVPDIYQGDELWNLALVDPDNRRAVDFDARFRALEEVERGFAGPPDDRRRFLAGLAERPESGLAKIHVIRAALEARRRCAAFSSRAYQPLVAEGPVAGRLVAFARGGGAASGGSLVAAVPRLVSARASAGAEPEPADWSDTRVRLPARWPREWTCALSGERLTADASGCLRAADLFRFLPGALLVSGAAT